MSAFIPWLGLGILAIVCFGLWYRFANVVSPKQASSGGLNPTLRKLLERLLEASPESDLESLKARRSVYNQAVSIYLKKVRSGFPEDDYYARVIRDLSRLRRKLHPPALLRRYLTSTRDLVPGLNLEVCLSEDLVLSGRLYFLDEDHLLVGIPDRAALSGIQAGIKVSLQIMVPGQGLYMFTCRVRTVMSGVRTGLKLEHTDDSPHPNRREYVRERVSFRFELRNEKNSEPISALAHDISGGGFCFLARCALPVGQSIWIKLPPEVSGGAVSIKARILRAAARDAVGTFRYAVMWEVLPAKNREAIIRFVQSEHLRRFRP